MCGIAGILSPPRRDLAARLSSMLQVQAHRGPDDRGELVEGSLALGQDRLSIIDLTECGHQPMLLDAGRLAIVFNGEIFNYIELREQLQAKGRVFASRSDTEVILHAYDEWGTACCERFNGMWSFALWDRDSRTLVCSRDRFGVKPFYYALTGGEFLFASEVKALLAASPRLAEADEAYLARFLATSLIDDGERTCFAQVRQLLPAHTMVVACGEEPRVASCEPYWRFDAERSREAYDYARPAETLRELLGDSVRLRLRSDVPVGTCLSGGLDSSSIVALASGQLGGPVWTYSALYPQADYDESRFVRLVNDAFPTVAHEIRPEPGRLLEVMSRIAWHQDEPTAGPGLYSQWHVMEGASSDVKVLLDGQGADELLGGYRAYYVQWLRSRLRAALASPSPATIRGLVSDRRIARSQLPGIDRQLVLEAAGPAGKRLWRALAGRGHRPEVRQEFLQAYAGDETAPRRPGVDPLSATLLDATFRTSLPALLRYEDRNSMAFSIEARTPFLDYRLVEFALALPFDERISGEWTKAVLRRAMADILPSEVTWRRDKLGYPTPFCEWSRGVFRGDIEEVIRSERFQSRGVFDVAAVEVMWADHLAGRADNAWNVWRWLSVELWFRTFIDGAAA